MFPGILPLLIATGVLNKEQRIFKSRHKQAIKICLNYGKSHDHNNSFCSAFCCKKFKELK